MNPLVIQLIAALIAQGPQMIGAVAALIKAAHGEPLDGAEHQALGKALAGAMAPWGRRSEPVRVSGVTQPNDSGPVIVTFRPGATPAHKLRLFAWAWRRAFGDTTAPATRTVVICERKRRHRQVSPFA